MTANVPARLLAAHNRERTAVGVSQLVWDPQLAADAASYGHTLAALNGAARVAVAQHWVSKAKASGTRHLLARFLQVDGKTIENINGRIAQCRRLAAFTTDQHVAKILIQMAEEAEADLRRIGAESADEPHQITIQAGGPKTGA